MFDMTARVQVNEGDTVVKNIHHATGSISKTKEMLKSKIVRIEKGSTEEKTYLSPDGAYRWEKKGHWESVYHYMCGNRDEWVEDYTKIPIIVLQVKQIGDNYLIEFIDEEDYRNS